MTNKDYIHDLIWKYHCTKDNAIILKLVSINRGYIYKLINKHYKMFGKQVEFKDLYQECLLGFIHAVNVFDFDKDVTLLTYADLWMRSYMFDLYTRSINVHIPVHLLRKLIYSNTKGKHEYFNLAKQAMAPVNLRAYNDGSKDMLLEKHLKPYVDATVMLFERYHVPEEFEQAFLNLSDSEINVINRLYQGYKPTEIVEEFGIDRNKIYRIISKTKNYVKKQVA